MQAIILAGGKGTRLKPYTVTIPKPLVPVGDLPILEILIMQLRNYGFREIIVSTGHLAELIEAYFKNGSKWGVKIRYVREERSLGTAGAIKNVKDMDDNFIVMNGDILTDIDYIDLYNFHLKHKGIATISAVKREIPVDFGVVETDNNSKLINYIEKPSYIRYVSMGINVFNKRCKRYISKGESIGIPELVLRMKSKKENIYCYKSKVYWLDIGRIEDFQAAQEEFERNRGKLLYEKHQCLNNWY